VDIVRRGNRFARGILHVGNSSGVYQDERVLSLRTVVSAALAGRDLEHPLHYGASSDDVFQVGTVDLLDLRRSAPNLDVGRGCRLWHGLQSHAALYNLTHAQCARVLPLVPKELRSAKD